MSYSENERWAALNKSLAAISRNQEKLTRAIVLKCLYELGLLSNSECADALMRLVGMTIPQKED